jgi:hypothetical protein
MFKTARRVGIALGSFVIAWFAIVNVAVWLFGSANFLAYVLAAVVGAGVYLDLLRRDRRVA